MRILELGGRAAVNSRVQDEVVFDAEFFEEPEDALGLRVLRAELG
jgi:hypothetical protein